MTRWKQLLKGSISTSMKEDKDSITYCLSTIRRLELAGSGAGQEGAAELRPESRTVVHRGFVDDRRGGQDDGGDQDPARENMLVCTDIRSPKIHQLGSAVFQSPDHGLLAPPAQPGAVASICWWFSPTGEQYRIQARAYVVSASNARGEVMKIGRLTAEQALRLGPGDRADLDYWESERVRIYEKLSWELKASFVAPSPPGTKLSLVLDDSQKSSLDLEKRLEAGDQELRAAALNNFALIVLEPISVDLVQLKTKPHRRFSWERTTSGGWEETELVP